MLNLFLPLHINTTIMQTIQENILNVTLLEPRQKHPTIFTRFDALNEGESLTIHNDHDPKPLYYQLLGERGNIFTWEYLEQGPEWWKIRIRKNISGENEETIGQIAAKDLRKAEIFKKYGIDFCCGGKKTVKQACAEKGLDVTNIEQELQQADKNFTTRPLPYNDWSIDFLADYIVNTHHSYVKKSLSEISNYAAKVAKVHGSRHPELKVIYQLVESINAELSSHMVKEEQGLFPYIKELVNAKKSAQSSYATHFVTVKNPVLLMEMEHEMVGKNLEEIRALSKNYSLPEDACASYTLLYKMLAEFEDDLHTHVHLENNILFPKAIELEKQISNERN
jgi:regulator of cell morphogenesis and NO signaling